MVSKSSVSRWRAYGAGLVGKRLLGGRDFSGHVARGIFPVFDGKKSLPVAAIEKIDEALLGSLGHRVDFFSIAPNRKQNWR